jgi:hypothetical protein
VTGWLDAVMVSLTAALITFLSFIPALIGAIIILVVGWVLSGLLARLLVGILERVGFERAAETTGVSDFIARTGVRDARASRVVGELVKWFIRLIFIEAAATALQLTAVTDVINRVVHAARAHGARERRASDALPPRPRSNPIVRTIGPQLLCEPRLVRTIGPQLVCEPRLVRTIREAGETGPVRRPGLFLSSSAFR